MNIDSLLEQIENILDSGTKITLSKKTAVNAEEIRECIAQLREIIPEEVDQAKSITANRSEIIEKAKSDAAASVARAQEKAQTLVEKTEAKSEQIISAANANAQKTVDSANKLAEETVAKAKSDAAAIVEKAQQTANKLLDENEITAQARAYASQLKVNSQNEATERVNSAIARAEETRSQTRLLRGRRSGLRISARLRATSPTASCAARTRLLSRA